LSTPNTSLIDRNCVSLVAAAGANTQPVAAASH
jgi:hypothetical protein